jgi:hypothetical protein
MMPLQQQLENRFKLPVVATQSGKIYVVDTFGKDASLFTAGRRNTLKFLQNRKITVNKRQLSAKLVIRYPEVSLPAALSAVEKIGIDATGVRSFNITIDAGPSSPQWTRLEKFVSAIISNLRSKSQTPVAVSIDGAFARPDEHHIDWLARRRVALRYVLGPALGYAADLNSRTAKILKAMSDEGLRVGVLFYWSGQGCGEVKKVFNRALRLNKFAGVGILPCFLSPRFDCRTINDRNNSDGFARIVSRLYSDRTLCEYLEEPVSDIENHLAGSAPARRVNWLITEIGDLLSFRQFPFTANHGSAKSSASPASQLIAPLCGLCTRCAWRHICGGVDAAPRRLIKQHKIALDSWCKHRKILMKRIIGECLEIREHLQRVKGLLPKEATQ